MTVTLILYQFMDRLLIMKAYRKPINFSNLLQRKILNVFLFIILLHIIITVIFLTEPFLVVAGDPSNEGSIK